MNNGGTPNNNFIVTFFSLLKEHKSNNSNEIRNEFGYFNYLLGEFAKYENKKEFKNLLLGVLYNFKSNNFHHTLGEIAVCLDLNLKFKFEKYERILGNEKSIDFEFIDDNGKSMLIDVLTIDYKKERYEKEKFKNFLDGRLREKFEDKSKKLDSEIKSKVFVFPILSGFTNEIIKEQSEYLKKVNNSTIEVDGFQTFPPRAFGNVQGTFFSLFTIDEIIDPEKIKKNYSQHSI
ncbi:hypothetical protein [Winogradskyella forsetii]|uniref:hypothetical protein n=1 Tax=Winogradskyella forsetii TaxID=2686077 RepID=UPI0015C1A719|nr:hypothetical protein [Winogradskyella forsetii]